MSLTSGFVNNPALNNLVQSSLQSKHKLEWIPGLEIANIEQTQINNVYCAIGKRKHYNDETITLVLLGSSEECTATLVSEFARIYSLPTHKYNNNDNNFRRYSVWLGYRNGLIKGFTKSNDDNYYMIAHKDFYHCYSLYGFCSTCGIFRCSPVWCICGYKQLSDGWTSNNHQLDDFIKKSQLQTNSPNDAYLEWISFGCIYDWGDGNVDLYGLPSWSVKFIPLEITDEPHDLYYAELCDMHPDILTTDVWLTIGFTYNASEQKYYLVKEFHGYGLCLACTQMLYHVINAFCYECKAPRPLDWSTGNKTLDSFIMESWSNVNWIYDAYIQWIEYSTLMNVREMTSLRHGCTRITDWLDPVMNKLIKVTLKQISDAQSLDYDFHQLTLEYPTILTPGNVWIVGITQEPSTRRYYLVFYYDTRTILDKMMQLYERVNIKYMQHSDFYELKEIGAGGYGTVYTAKYKKYSEVKDMKETVVLKRFKNFDEIKMSELFISEFRNQARCTIHYFLPLYGVTQDPETQEYMIVMQYANNGSLLSYLDQNINKLTWKDKLEHLREIANYLITIHDARLVHCDLHGGNIIMHNDTSFICDLGLSRSMNSHESNSTVQGVLPFIAPEVFHTGKFTQRSDIYAFGIIMYLIATGEPPFRDRQFDRDLVCDIMGGLRPTMPDSAPEEYKKLAERCCDADPNKRPDADSLTNDIYKLFNEIDKDNSDNNKWNTIHNSDVKPLSRLEKANKYSSTLLPTGDLPKPRNSYDLDLAAGMKTTIGYDDVNL